MKRETILYCIIIWLSWLGRDVLGVPVTFSLDPASSNLEATTRLFLFAQPLTFAEQGKDSMAADFGGDIVIDVDDPRSPSFLQFESALAAAEISGDWLPGFGGGSEDSPGIPEPANYGVILEEGDVTIWGAVRDLVISVDSGLLPVTNGSFASEQSFEIFSGIVDFNFRSFFLGSSAGRSSQAGAVSVNEIGLAGAYIVDGEFATLSIPIVLSYSFPILTGRAEVSFAGEWVSAPVNIGELGPAAPTQLQAGDANEDSQFDQLDLVQVQIAAKYLTGHAATWGEGDWNGAPGGSVGSPPVGDGLFNQFDIIAAQRAGVYLTGPYAALGSGRQENNGQTWGIYDAGTGEVAVDATEGTELTSINIASTEAIFTGASARNLGASFDNDADETIFKTAFAGRSDSISFGNVAQPRLTKDFALVDVSVVSSLTGCGDLGIVDLVYVPEPPSAILLSSGVVFGLLRFRRAH